MEKLLIRWLTMWKNIDTISILMRSERGWGMFSLKEEAEVCRIGLIIGYLLKVDIINWADRIIETHESFPYEIIEVSLLMESSEIDISSKLFEIPGIANEQRIVNAILGICSYSYNINKFTADEICTFLYRLVSTKTDVYVSSEIERKIHYLSDGYLLASEGTYGNLKDVCVELKEFLDKYTIYAKGILYFE